MEQPRAAGSDLGSRCKKGERKACLQKASAICETRIFLHASNLHTLLRGHAEQRRDQQKLGAQLPAPTSQWHTRWIYTWQWEVLNESRFKEWLRPGLAHTSNAALPPQKAFACFPALELQACCRCPASVNKLPDHSTNTRKKVEKTVKKDLITPVGRGTTSLSSHDR